MFFTKWSCWWNLKSIQIYASMWHDLMELDYCWIWTKWACGWSTQTIHGNASTRCSLMECDDHIVCTERAYKWSPTIFQQNALTRYGLMECYDYRVYAYWVCWQGPEAIQWNASMMWFHGIQWLPDLCKTCIARRIFSFFSKHNWQVWNQTQKTFTTILLACSNLIALELGMEIYEKIIRSRH